MINKISSQQSPVILESYKMEAEEKNGKGA